MIAYVSSHINAIWLCIGMFGQGLFSGRFLIQWLASERIKQSIVPNLFWYFSLAGGLTLLAYAIHRKDPVIILGQASGILVYARNLYFIHNKKHSSGHQVATEVS